LACHVVAAKLTYRAAKLCTRLRVEYLTRMNAKTLVTIGAVMLAGFINGNFANAQNQPMGVADVKALAKAEVSDEVILSQIRNTHGVFHLTTAEILDLKDAGVSQKVIDFMINSPSVVGSEPPPSYAKPGEAVVVAGPPPEPVAEEVIVRPGPDYVWIAGTWSWYGGRWVWVRGRWAFPPRRGAVWVPGYWARRHGRVVWFGGYWR